LTTGQFRVYIEKRTLVAALTAHKEANCYLHNQRGFHRYPQTMKAQILVGNLLIFYDYKIARFLEHIVSFFVTLLILCGTSAVAGVPLIAYCCWRPFCYLHHCCCLSPCWCCLSVLLLVHLLLLLLLLLTVAGVPTVADI